jgi:hypothetical protein
MVNCLIFYFVSVILLIYEPDWAFYIITIAALYTIITSLFTPKQAPYHEAFDSVPSKNPVSITSGYGFIDDNISYGNPQSWSDRLNPYIDTNLWGVQDAVVTQGTPGPLSYEEHATTPVEKSMFYFSNYACKPECCLFSPYACNKGCVCWEAPREKSYPIIQNLRTTPTS